MTNTNTILNENHISFMSTHGLVDICAPLFKRTDIDFFSYARFYPDNSMVVLNTYTEWFDFLFRKRRGMEVGSYEQLDLLAGSQKKLFQEKSNQYSWFLEDTTKSGPFKTLLETFRIKSFLTFAEKLEGYWEYFGFASCSGKNITSFYLNNYDLLQKFMVYFQEKASDIIKANEKQRIILPYRSNEYKQFITNLVIELNRDQQNIQTLQKAFQLKKYPIIHNGTKTYISRKELECLKLLSEGKSYKNIAGILNLSDRTIESHIQNVRNRMNSVYSKDELLNVFRSSRLWLFNN